MISEKKSIVSQALWSCFKKKTEWKETHFCKQVKDVDAYEEEHIFMRKSRILITWCYEKTNY